MKGESKQPVFSKPFLALLFLPSIGFVVSSNQLFQSYSSVSNLVLLRRISLHYYTGADDGFSE
jgi:hypothetical protein